MGPPPRLGLRRRRRVGQPGRRRRYPRVRLLPLGDELVVAPGRVDDQGFSDISPHREAVPSVYARYGRTTADRAYSPGREDHQMLLWPLFVTSFVVDDFLGDLDLYGARTVVVSSASSKTAIGAAFLLAERDGLEVVGLTSPGNVDFVRSLGCYGTVLPYDDADRLTATPSVYVDVAGRRDVTRAVHTHLGDDLRYSMVVGDTHWDDTTEVGGGLPGPDPEFLFAPVRIATRRGRLGTGRLRGGGGRRLGPVRPVDRRLADHPPRRRGRGRRGRVPGRARRTLRPGRGRHLHTGRTVGSPG